MTGNLKEIIPEDGGKGTWGGRAKVFGTVPVCVRVPEKAGEGWVFWRQNRFRGTVGVSEIDEDNNQAKDWYKVGIGYHVVLPPYTGNYMPPRADLSFAGLDNYVFKFKISETRTSESDSEDECEEKTSTKQDISGNDNLVKYIESTKKYVSEKHINNHDENLRKRHDSRVDWNGMNTQKQGIGFGFNKRACFICGSVNHLIKDCTFYENKIVEKSVISNKGKGSGQREVRPVWNNARRVNHQNFSKMTHPHPKRNFVLTAVATKSGHVLVNVAKQCSATSTSTARPKVNTAAIRPNVNVKSSYFKPDYTKRRHFNQKLAAKTNTFLRKINTAKGKNVTTTGPKVVVNAIEGKKENAVKPSACWIWRPKGKLVDHTSKDRQSTIYFTGSSLERKLCFACVGFQTTPQMVINSPCLTDKKELASTGQTATGFEKIINFLKSKPIHYALTVNPTIYVSCVKQFWATVKVKKVNDQEQIQVVVDKKKVTITEDNIRSDLHFDDAKGTACLLNEAIFTGLFLIHTILQCLSAKTTAWNEFSSSMASAIICLADNQKFNFSKYIFGKQVEGMARHKEMYLISSHTKKIFANMKRIEAGFSEVITPLFDTMMVQAPADIGDTPVETYQTPIVDQPSTSKPQKKQNPKRKQRKEAEVSNDEPKDEDHVPTPSSDPLPSGEDSFILNELMVFCTSYQEQRKSRFRGFRRLKKFGSGKRVKPPLEKDNLGAQEDASKQERMIEEIDQNAEIALDDESQGRTNDDEMFGVNDLAGEEVVVVTTTGEHKEQIIKDVSTAEPVTTAGEVVTTTIKDSATPTTNVTEDKITIAQALAALNSIKPKVVVQEQEMSTTITAAATTVTTTVPTPREKGIVFHKQKQSQIPTISSSKNKGKAKMIEPEVSIKKKDQMRINEEEMRKVNDFIAVDSKAPESSTKRTADHLESNISKKQKVDENVEAIIDDSEELKKCIEIVPGDGDEVLIEATPLSSRSPTIIDYKIYKEGKKTYFKIIRADGNSQVYQTFEKMFKNFNREDLEVLCAIVKDRFKKEKPVDDMDNLLFRTLKTMFEHHVEDNIWKYQQGLAKVYPFKRNTLHQLWSDVRLQVDYDVEMAYDLLRFIRKQLMEELWYPTGTDIETVVHADSDHARDYVDRKSTSGICTFVGCCLTSWFSKKRTALAISTTKAEYISTGKACAIDLSKNPVQHSRTKHIKIRHHFLRDNVQKGHILIEKVSSVDNIAEVLTKPLKQFAQILDVPCEGACVFTNKWSLDELAYCVPTDGPYQTNLPSPDDIISSIRIDREGQFRRIRHEEEIDVLEYQVLTREIDQP
nr:copia protein [Tanacetum cinerariifolium]